MEEHITASNSIKLSHVYACNVLQFIIADFKSFFKNNLFLSYFEGLKYLSLQLKMSFHTRYDFIPSYFLS